MDAKKSEKIAKADFQQGKKNTKNSEVEQSTIAKEYASQAKSAEQSGFYENALIYCNQAIFLKPQEPDHYRLRAKIYRRLGQFDNASIGEQQADILQYPQYSTILMRELDAKNERYFPSDILRKIAEFASLSTLSSLARTNKKNFKALIHLLDQRGQVVWKKMQENYALSDLVSSQWSQVLHDNPIRKIKILQKAIVNRDFLFIQSLIRQKIDVNSVYTETLQSIHTETYIGRVAHGEIEVEKTRTVTYTEYVHHHALNEAVRSEPFPIEIIAKLIDLGLIVPEHMTSLLLDSALATLAEKPRSFSSNERKKSAEKILIFIINAMNLSEITDETAIRILKTAKLLKENYSCIKRLEAIFLIKLLKGVIPSWLNFLADRADVPLISVGIKNLTLFAKSKITPSDLQWLEYVKAMLFQTSKPALHAKPRDLHARLKKIMEDQVIAIDTSKDVKLLYPSTISPSRFIFVSSPMQLPSYSSSSNNRETSIPDAKIQTLVCEISGDLQRLSQTKPDLAEEYGSTLTTLRRQQVTHHHADSLLELQENIRRNLPPSQSSMSRR